MSSSPDPMKETSPYAPRASVRAIPRPALPEGTVSVSPPSGETKPAPPWTYQEADSPRAPSCAYVSIGDGSTILRTGPSGVCFYVHIGPAKAAPADIERAAVAANTDLNI